MLAEQCIWLFHYSKYYKEDGELALDVGAFSVALEVTSAVFIVFLLLSVSLQHATGVKPYVIGKPSSVYYKAALKELGVAPEMVSCGISKGQRFILLLDHFTGWVYKYA